MTNVLHVRAFEDNYIWLIPGKSPGHVAIVDPGDAAPVLEAMDKQGLKPSAILCTHHHGDHVGGVEDILKRYIIPVYGPARERIPAITHPLKQGDHIDIPELDLGFDVLEVPGHTLGHIAYYGGGMLFCGDTLFSAGCGRLFEGTAQQMHDSLSQLAALPEATKMYCGHEYTEANLRFAAAVEPENADVHAHCLQARAWRSKNQPTLPSTIGLERRINPFLRSDVLSVRRAAERHNGGTIGSAVEIFAAVRRWKDSFKG